MAVAAILSCGREATARAIGFFFRQSHSAQFVRPLSVLAEAAKPKRKKKNLFEVAQFLPNWGIGYQMAKNHWQGTSYKITKINLYKDGRHGKAWGVFHRDGTPSVEGPKKISGVHKRGWRYIPEPRKKQQATPEAETPSLA